MTKHASGRVPIVSTPIESSSSRDLSSVTADATQQSGDEQVERFTFAEEAVRQIEVLVESFRTGKTKKPQTIYKIGQILANESGGSEQHRSDSLDGYASTLDSIEALSAQSDRHGAYLSGSALGKRKDSSGDGDRRSEQPNGGDTAVPPSGIDNFIHKLSEEQEVDKGSDAGDHESEDDEQGSGDESGKQGRSNKKQRIYESEMPWFRNEQRIRKSSTNRSCNKTRNILDIIQ